MLFTPAPLLSLKFNTAQRTEGTKCQAYYRHPPTWSFSHTKKGDGVTKAREFVIQEGGQPLIGRNNQSPFSLVDTSSTITHTHITGNLHMKGKAADGNWRGAVGGRGADGGGRVKGNIYRERGEGVWGERLRGGEIRRNMLGEGVTNRNTLIPCTLCILYILYSTPPEQLFSNFIHSSQRKFID
jgi:hypothetical protein